MLSVGNVVLNDTAVSIAPQPGWNDYFQMVYFFFAATFGIAVNVGTLFRLRRTHETSTLDPHRSGSLSRLTMHLCIANLCILCFHCVGTGLWLALWSWKADEFTCRLFRFVAPFGFYLLSYLVVSVSLDIAFVMNNPLSARVNGNQRTKVLIGLSYILALAFSFPNLLLWTLVSPFQNSDYTQCASVLALDARHASFALVYDLTHDMLVFWIPFAAIAPAYLYVTFKTMRLMDRIETGKPKLDNEKNDPLRRQSKDIGRLRDASNYNAGKSLLTIPAKQRLCIDADSCISNIFDFSTLPKDSKQHKYRSKRRKVLRSSLLIVISYVLCWLPYQMVNLWKYVDKASWEVYCYYFDWLEVLITLHACLNPFLYQSDSLGSRKASQNLYSMLRYTLTTTEGNTTVRRKTLPLVSSSPGSHYRSLL